MEYLIVHRGGRGQSFVYELVFERGDHRAAVAGTDHVYDGNREGKKGRSTVKFAAKFGAMSRGSHDPAC